MTQERLGQTGTPARTTLLRRLHASLRGEQALEPPRYASPAISPSGPGQDVIEHDSPTHAGGGRRLRAGIGGLWFRFLLLVLAPSLGIWAYLAFFASDQYVAETRFAVRMAQFDFRMTDRQRPQATGAQTGSPLASALPSLAGQEAYVVANYVRSQAIFADLPAGLDLRAIYTRPEADFWARLKSGASLEELTQYWRSVVTTRVESTSGIVGVTVSAFRPDDALAVAEAIVAASERLANRLSERVRADSMGRAEEEVRRSEAQVRAVLQEMRAYRDREGLIDPGKQAAALSSLLLQSMGERIRLQGEYFSLSRGLTPNAPTVTILKTRLDAVDAEIERLKAQLTGSSDQRTIASAIAGFEELEIKRQFAERLYQMAQNALERARQKVEWQNVYLSVFVPPNLPQSALYPERIRLSLLFPLIFLILWGIGELASATIRDHRA